MENQSLEYGQQNFTLPHDVVPLPTQGVFYKNKKKSIKVGYLTANDENILMAGGPDMTQNLLRSKIYEPDIRIEDLMEGDVEAILIYFQSNLSNFLSFFHPIVFDIFPSIFLKKVPVLVD